MLGGRLLQGIHDILMVMDEKVSEHFKIAVIYRC
jgi:hypothetical protein